MPPPEASHELPVSASSLPWPSGTATLGYLFSQASTAIMSAPSSASRTRVEAALAAPRTGDERDLPVEQSHPGSS